MQHSSGFARPRIPGTSRNSLDGFFDSVSPHVPPLTPAVTGITYPSPTNTFPDRGRQPPFAMIATSGPLSHHHSSSDDSIAPITPTDIDTLDQLWSSIRLEKERKMAKEPPKVRSFGDGIHDPDHPSSSYEAIPEPLQVLKKQKSLAAFRESTDGRMATAKFDMPGIKKQDVHVSFQRTRLVVTWQTVTTTEREEDGRLIRDRQEKTYSQNIPLPEGTRFEQVRAAMNARHLILKYPNVRSGRSDSRSREYLHA